MTVIDTIDLGGGKRISVATAYLHKDLVKALPGATWSSSHSTWTMPLSWQACLALRSTFGDDLEIGDGLRTWAAQERARVERGRALRTTQESTDGTGDPRLFPFQRAGVEYLRSMRRALLLDEMGSGKTVQAISALFAESEAGGAVLPLLVVCPNSMKTTWKREIDKWWPGLNVVAVAGSAVQRRRQLEPGADVYILNWESLRAHSSVAPFGSIALSKCTACGGADGKVTAARCQVHKRELNRIAFNSVIADECHRSKDPTAVQTRALWSAAGDASIRFGLTGTPIANDPTELWSVLHFIDPEAFPTKSKWVNRFVQFHFNVFGGRDPLGLRPDTLEEFREGTDHLMRRIPKEIAVPFLPPVMFERRDVEMTVKQQRAYEQMREGLVAQLDDSVLMAANAMVQVGRLLQLSSSMGTMEVQPDGSERLILTEPSSKIDAFLDDLPDFGDESVLTFAVSRQLIDLLSARMAKKGIPHGLVTGATTAEQRQRAMDDFQSGKTKHILCTVGAGGTGITLTKASTVVYLQRPWSFVDYEQSKARAHRIGSEQHDSITIIDYVTPNTIEEAVIATLARKGDLSQEVVRDAEFLRRILNGTER